MTTPLHLTDDELLSLTHLRRPSAQARALQAMALPRRNHSARRQPMGCGGAGRREDF